MKEFLNKKFIRKEPLTNVDKARVDKSFTILALW